MSTLQPPEIRFVVDASRVVRTTFSGTLTSSHIVEHLQERERAGVLALPQVIDARDARLDLSVEAIQELAAYTRELRLRTPIGPTAVVVASDLAYGIARMYAGFDAPDSAGHAVFRSVAEAEAWLETVR